MKRAIFAVIFCLAAASTAAAADDSLAGLIQAGNRDAALKMIAAGADVNAAQGDGTTPVHWAVYKIDVDLARALLERKAKPDVINSYGSSPLAEAVKVANAGLVKMLLDAGLMKDLKRTFRDPRKFAYDAHKGYWAHHNSLGGEVL